MPPSKLPVHPSRPILQRRRQWEHTTLSAEQPLAAKALDVYGAEGWELVTMYVRHDAVYAVFKREVTQ